MSELQKLRLYDNSRVSDAKKCLRYFLFRHVWHWTPDRKSYPLLFGSAWHAGMDVIWENHAAPKAEFGKVVDLAYEAFKKSWVEDGGPRPEEISPDEADEISPRLPMIALEMYYEYIEQRQHIFKDPSFELLEIEEPFAVPLDPNDPALWYVGRLDKKFKFRKRYYIAEHKTTTSYRKGGPFRHDFIDSFSPNSQIDGYLYRMRMEYGEKSGGVWVDAALVHKTVHDGFKIIPEDHQFAQIDAWLWTTHYWIDQIEENKTLLAERSELDTPYLAVFPQNTASCGNFGGCAFRDICNAVANPAKLKGVPPLGYKIEKWSPFEEIKLEKIGFTTEKTTETVTA